MHVEDVVGGDGVRTLAVAIIGARPRCFVGDEPEGRAAAGATFNLQEQEVVPTGQEPDPVGRDALLADGAAETVDERAKVILRIHPREV